MRGVAGGCDGSVHHHLGVLAGTLGRRDDAERHFRRALERNARLGSPPLLAHTQAAYGALLLAGDPARASALLDAALATARTLGMAPLSAASRRCARRRRRRPARRCSGTRASCGRSSTAAPSSGSATAAGCATWPGCSASPGARWPRWSWRALRRPPRTRSPRTACRARALADDHAGPLLDAQAKAAYRARLGDLREELEQAERWHDTERAAQARHELDALGDALAAAVGRGGRDRHAAAGGERARMSVSKAIRTAVRRIGEHDPALGEHLAKAVRTGTLCSYAPDARAAIRWTVDPPG